MRNRGGRNGVNAAGAGLATGLVVLGVGAAIATVLYLGVIVLAVLLPLGFVCGLLGRGFHALADVCHRRHARKRNARRPHPNGFYMPQNGQRPQAYYSSRR